MTEEDLLPVATRIRSAEWGTFASCENLLFEYSGPHNVAVIPRHD